MAGEPNGTIVERSPNRGDALPLLSTSPREGSFPQFSSKANDGIPVSPANRTVTDLHDLGSCLFKHSETALVNNANVGPLKSPSDKQIGISQALLTGEHGQGGGSSHIEAKEAGDPIEHVTKKLKTGAGTSVDRRALIDAAIKQTSEIVLVLAGMGQMRAGKSPTAIERGLMAEARYQLGYLAGQLAPKDLVSKEGIETVIKDLGLSRLKDRTENAAPKKSIAQRASETMKKIEQARQSAISTAMASSSGGKLERVPVNATSRGASSALPTRVAQPIPVEKPAIMAQPAPAARPVASLGPVVPWVPIAPPASVAPLGPAETRPQVVPWAAVMPRAPGTAVTPVAALAPVTRAETQLTVAGSSTIGVIQSVPEAQPVQVEQPLQAQKSGRLSQPVSDVNPGMVSEDKLAFMSAAAATVARDHSRGFVPSSSKASSPVQTSFLSPIKVSKDAGLPGQPPRKGEINRVAKDILSTSIQFEEKDSKAPSMPVALGNFHMVQAHPQGPQGPKVAESLASRANHSDIARNVQKILQARPLEHQQWEPPSKAYMNAPISCQICKIDVKDIDTILVCDSCEKGVHLKCLQSYNQRGIPKGEWYCPKCLVASKGRPLPPKYGRVGKSPVVQRAPVSKSSFQSSPVKKLETPQLKTHQPTAISNGLNTTSEIPIHVDLTHSNKRHMFQGTGDTSVDLKQNPEMSLAQPRMEVADGTNQPLNFTFSYQSSGGFSAVSASPAENENQCSPNNEVSHVLHQQSAHADGSILSSHAGFKGFQPKQQSNINLHAMKQPQTLSNSQGADRITMLQAVNVSGNILQSSGMQRLPLESKCLPLPLFSVVGQTSSMTGSDVSHEDGNAQWRTSNKTFGPDAKSLDERNDQIRSTEEEDMYRVEWVGEKLQATEGKTYYQSCCVKGVLYKLQDYALFRPETPNVPPYIARLQVLWEDDNTGSKWVRVNWCYYPNDIPRVVGRPSMPEKDEVYESNHGDNNLVGSIQGPCEVLSSEKYREEIERRRALLEQGHDIGALHPIFMCKWFYDAPRGVFRAVVC